MAESNTYVGVTSGTGVAHRGTYQLLTSRQKISTTVQWAAFTKTPFMRMLALEAFGVDAVTDIEKFGVAETSGRMIVYHKGIHSFAGSIFATAGNSTHVGRFGSFTPQSVEGGDEWIYSWHRLIMSDFIPDVDVQDNGGGYIDIKAQKTEGMKQQYVQHINYAFLGNSSAPNHGVMGPSSVNHDLANLISVDQSRTIGGISKSGNTYWNNGTKAIASIGGGGEMDRPLTLRRSLMDAKNDQMAYAEVSDDYAYLCSQGAWQYYDRLMYADTIQSGKFPVVGAYDAAGINHKAFDGGPLLWDPSVVVPYASSAVTAGTEVIYGIHREYYAISLRQEEAFLVTGWEEPREHDQHRTLVRQIRTRYTPFVTQMRPHFVAYNLPANPD